MVTIIGDDSSSAWQKGYIAACENLGAALGRAGIVAHERGISNIVIYLMNPSSQLSSNLDLSRCFSKMLSTYSNTAQHHPSTKANFSTRQFVMQIVPLDHALRLDHTCTIVTLKDIAFSVYSRCHSIEGRQVKKRIALYFMQKNSKPKIFILEEFINNIACTYYSNNINRHVTIRVPYQAFIPHHGLLLNKYLIRSNYQSRNH